MEAKLAVLNNKIDAMQKELSWLVAFAKEVDPRLGWLEMYAELLPASLTVIEDLKLENRQLRQRQNNTAVIYGQILAIKERANPPIVMVGNASDEFEVHIPDLLFAASILEIGGMIRIEAKLRNHTIPGRGKFTVFWATGIEKLNPGTVDNIFENGYNDN